MSIDQERAIAYLLGELEVEERGRFESELAESSDLRAIVEELRPVFSRLETLPDEAWEAPEAPELDIARVTAPDPAEPPLEAREQDFETVRNEAGRKRKGSWIRVAGFLATGAALLLVGFLIGNSTGGEEQPASPSGTGPELVLDSFGEAPPSAQGGVRMVSSEGDQMRLEVSGLKPSQDKEFYELWLLGKEGELIALGSFRVGGEGKRSIEVPLPVDPANFQYFDVSVQPDNGDPGHSGRSVLRGLTTN